MISLQTDDENMSRRQIEAEKMKIQPIRKGKNCNLKLGKEVAQRE